MVIDTMWEEELFRYNTFLERLLDLPHFHESIAYSKAYLLTRPRLSLKNSLECYTDLNFENIITIGKNLKSSYGWFDDVLGVLIFTQVLFVSIVYFKYQKALSRQVRNPLNNIKFIREDGVIIGFHAFQVFMTLILWAATFIKSRILKGQEEEFSEISALSCFDNQGVRQALQDLADEIPRAIYQIPFLASTLLLACILGFVGSYLDIFITKVVKLKRD